ncbi:sigma-70 family RNA polymerase sigma factor [Solimonas marina]|uniref:Sigma-70 family RNA polymerase sigma factor n=1 Tax=Solimonas marina TaxID=2714601 RepID=A0A970B658_9GAMM|nr:sigma-70 family RNA polymerase sigma factor [Solimonas marina]NKF22295.1 sigma-70 family RNA polymerase sigma factor [Solimonas marina]
MHSIDGRREGGAQDEADSAAFETHRAFLIGLAYRMLGSHAEAEDVVQDAWLRWQDAARGAVRVPRAFLAKTVTRLCLDRMKSARAQREVYFGPWLPEPLLDGDVPSVDGPAPAVELASDLSYAFLLALERLSPLERAAFLLHDVFELDFAEIAAALQRTPASCRQLAARAREHLREARPRFAVTADQGERLVRAFVQASHSGDVETLKSLLAEDAQLLADGGRRVATIGVPILGRARLLKVYMGMLRKHGPAPDTRLEFMRINGLPGVLLRTQGGVPIQTIALEPDAGGRICGIYIVRNPDKLRRFLND